MAEEKKVSEKIKKIVSEIETLNALELSELADYLEEKFGVQAVAPVAAAAPAGTQDQPKEEEKSTYTVVLKEIGANKLNVIKTLREILPNLGLMDAKKLAESAPKEILTDVKKEQAEEAKKKLESAGAKVELK